MLTSHPAARWGLHVAAYLVLLVGLLGLVDRHDGWNFDDGAYATQVRCCATATGARGPTRTATSTATRRRSSPRCRTAP
ncbi:MAG: hypothetical protein R2746_12355 [Acidimicrobiales bacterium]